MNQYYSKNRYIFSQYQCESYNNNQCPKWTNLTLKLEKKIGVSWNYCTQTYILDHNERLK